MSTSMNRRGFLQGAAGAGALLSTVAAPAEAKQKRYQEKESLWPLCLNVSTIRPASFADKIGAAAAAGYDAIEPWISDLEQHEAEGKSLKDAAKEIADKGMWVPNIIGLWDCMPATEEEFQASLPATRERMRRMSEIGSVHAAAIPQPDRTDFDLKWGADKYRELMRIGREDYNIKVAFEFIGFFKGVHRTGQAAAVAIDSDDPEACLIMDTFHLFRGGSGFNGIKMMAPNLIGNFHWNDVPGDVPREEQGDAHRIYPGDGVLPLVQALKDLKEIGYFGTLSLEMFNRAHWEQDPYEVAKTGKEKMLEGIRKALA
ncbi:MAG: sugar phosphate isomerase/epimerase [Candidatus Hydrogenedentes bacterium]|nr:sugar phosphate isomerase/epimerase [Candidatus Hydrogenedentota bacterium]